jgi:competence protein ComEA
MRRFFQRFFSFSRKEQRGIIALTALIIIVLLLRNLLPGWQDRRVRDFSGYEEEIERFEESVSGSREPPADAPGALININAADSIELREIRGIGPVLSKRIVRYRYLLGGFVRSGQLKEVYGIDDRRYEQISGQFCIDTALIRHIPLNRVDRYTLARHPYLSDEQAGAVIRYRADHGRIDRPSQLLEERILDKETFDKISPYLRTD